MSSAFSFDPTLIQSVTAGLETLVNQALKYDPASRAKIAAIDKILAVEITTPSVCIYFRGQTQGIAILAYCETPAAAHLQGSISGLLSLLKGSSSLANSDVNLVGDTDVLQQWQAALKDVDIDWEDMISQVLGDIAGPITANSMRTSAQWAKQQAREQQRLVSEYLPEELKVVPSQAQAEALFTGIADLAMDSDRLAARIKQFANKLHSNTATNEPNE